MHIVFVLGLLLSGLSLGWLIGGSQTPVAGASIPVIFGAVAAVFSMLSGLGIKLPSQEKPEDEAEGTGGEKAATSTMLPGYLELLELNRKTMLKLFGWTMFSFFVGFCAGLYLGAAARNQQWFRPRNVPSLPWADGHEPDTLELATAWFVLNDRLIERGYSREQIEEVLAAIRPAALQQARPIHSIPWEADAENRPASVQDAMLRISYAQDLSALGYSEEDVKSIISLPWGSQESASTGTESSHAAGSDHTAQGSNTQMVTTPPVVISTPVLDPHIYSPVMNVGPDRTLLEEIRLRNTNPAVQSPTPFGGNQVREAFGDVIPAQQ